MPFEERGGAAPAFIACVGFMPGAQMQQIDQSRGGGQRQLVAVLFQMFLDLRAQHRKRLADLLKAKRLCCRPHVLPVAVVDILKPPCLVATDRLQMRIAVAGDANLRPCRRDREFRDALDIAPPNRALSVSQELKTVAASNALDG